MSYHNVNYNQRATSQTATSGILTYINSIPLFKTLAQALEYGKSTNLQGYHTHVFEGVTGFMAGSTHENAVQVLAIENEQRQITNFSINTNDLTSIKETRPFSITGDPGSRFIMQIIQKSSSSSVLEKYYNFNTRVFETSSLGTNIDHFLRKELDTTTFSSNIVFPSSTAGGYKILLMADPDSTTNLSPGLSSANVISKDIEDVSDVTVTVVFKTANTSSYASNPPSANLTSDSYSGSQSSATNIDIAKTLTNTSSDANGFGLRVTSAFNNETGFYCEKTHTVNGAISSSKTIVLDGVDNLVEGATITSVSSGSVSGTPEIETIDVDNKTITLIGNNQSFSDGVTLTFRVTGSSLINEAFGLNILDSNGLLTSLTETIITDTTTAAEGVTKTTNSLYLTKTVRGSVSADDGESGSLNLNGTYGIAGGNAVTVIGFGFDLGTTITTVNTPSSSAGAVTTNKGHQALTAGTSLTFVGSAQSITLTNCLLSITSFPTADLTVNLDLDSFITPGAAS